MDRAEWFQKRLSEREAWTQQQVARGISRDACLDPALTAISEYYIDQALKNTPFTAHLIEADSGEETV